MTKEIYAFIDGQNLYMGLKRSKLQLDYRLFRKYLAMKYGVTRAFLYIGYLQEYEHIYHFLRKAGFVLVFKEVVRVFEKPKGNVDVLLSVEVMYRLCTGEFQKAILVTSDGDFAPLVSALKKEDKLLAVLSIEEETCSVLLKKSAQGKVRYMRDFIHKMKRRSADT